MHQRDAQCRVQGDAVKIKEAFFNPWIFRYKSAWVPRSIDIFLSQSIAEHFPGGSDGKESACSAGDQGSIPGSGRSPGGEGMATYSSILAWRIPWTVEHGRLQSVGSKRVRHDWATTPHTHTQLIAEHPGFLTPGSAAFPRGLSTNAGLCTLE